MTELLLDPNIRIFVHLSISLITFLISIFRAYMFKLVCNEEHTDLRILQCNQALKRAEILLENGHLLVHRSFLSRRLFFCDEKRGFFRIYEAQNSKKLEDSDKSFIRDVKALAEYCRNNLVTVVPTIIAGTWVHFTFADLVSTKVPFFITHQFKEILQSGISVDDLDPSWVSSSSWYCMNVFGFPHISKVILATNEENSLEPEPPTAAAALLKETKELCQNSRENLEIYHHKWSLVEEFTYDYRS